jgi:hypothetical protein
VWNLEDLTYTGAIRYGDKVWLQLGRHEILGTSPIEPHDRYGLLLRQSKAADGPFGDRMDVHEAYGTWEG